MKVLGIMGSPRIGGNSDILLDEALAGAKDAGAEVEKIILDKKKISGCKDCKKCNETGICVIKDDMLQIHKKILDADAIIHSVPVYFWSMTSQMKSCLDRMTKMRWLGVVMASAADKEDIIKNEKARKQAFELGKKAATP